MFGIEEEGGVPNQIVGVEGDLDAHILRLESMAQDGISPRIPGIRTKALSCSSGSVLFMRIPKSWADPKKISRAAITHPASFVAFDVLHTDRDRTSEPLMNRKGLLADVINPSSVLGYRLEPTFALIVGLNFPTVQNKPVATVEYGFSSDEKQAFLTIAKEIHTYKKGKVQWIEPPIVAGFNTRTEPIRTI